MDAGMAGTAGWEFYEVPDEVTDKELSEFAWQCGLNHAEMYGIYPREQYVPTDDDDDDYDEDGDCYSDNIEGWWEPYDPDQHDGHSLGGTIYWNEY